VQRRLGIVDEEDIAAVKGRANLPRIGLERQDLGARGSAERRAVYTPSMHHTTVPSPQ